MANTDHTAPATKGDIARVLGSISDLAQSVDKFRDDFDEHANVMDRQFQTVLQHVEARAAETKKHVDESIEKLTKKLSHILKYEKRLAACERRLGLAV